MGGSIAGLTLAHGLEKWGIDYVLLERQEKHAAQRGAGISILPNGARILRQFNVWKHIKAVSGVVTRARLCYPDGFSFSNELPAALHEQYVTQITAASQVS